jgi:FixJ family two-component response regulator
VPAIVVVVDDDASVRRAVDRLLRSAGFGVVTFESAEQFLTVCHSEVVACLILDLQLGGMRGAELQELMAASGINVPTVIITAYDDIATREAAKSSGAYAFLRKPFEGQELIDAVTKAVATRN